MDYDGFSRINDAKTNLDPSHGGRSYLREHEQLQEQEQELSNQQRPQPCETQQLTYSGAPSPWLQSNLHQNQRVYLSTNQSLDNQVDNVDTATKTCSHLPPDQPGQPQRRQPYQRDSNDTQYQGSIVEVSTEARTDINNNRSVNEGSCSAEGTVLDLEDQIMALKQELRAKSESNFELNATIVTMQAEMEAEINSTKHQAREEASRLQGELRLARQQALRAQQQLTTYKQKQQHDQLQQVHDQGQDTQKFQKASAQNFLGSAVTPTLQSDRLLGITETWVGGGSKGVGSGYVPSASDDFAVPHVVSTKLTTNSATGRRQRVPANMKENIEIPAECSLRASLMQLEERRRSGFPVDGENEEERNHFSNRKVIDFPLYPDPRSTSLTYPGKIFAGHLVDLTASMVSASNGERNSSPLRETLIGISTSSTMILRTGEKHQLENGRPHEYMGFLPIISSYEWTEASVVWCIVQALVMEFKEVKNHKEGLQRNELKEDQKEAPSQSQESQPQQSPVDSKETTAMEVDLNAPPTSGENVKKTTRSRKSDVANPSDKKSIGGILSVSNLIQYLYILNQALIVSAEGRSELIGCFHDGQTQEQSKFRTYPSVEDSNVTRDPKKATKMMASNGRRFSSRLRTVHVTKKSGSDIDGMDENDEGTVPEAAIGLSQELIDVSIWKLQSTFQKTDEERFFRQQRVFDLVMPHCKGIRDEFGILSKHRHRYWSQQLICGLLDALSLKIYDPRSSTETTSNLCDRNDCYSIALQSCHILTIIISSDNRHEHDWWKACVEPLMRALHYYVSLLISELTTVTSITVSASPLTSKVSTNTTNAQQFVRRRRTSQQQQQHSASYFPYRHQHRQKRQRREFRRVATAQFSKETSGNKMSERASEQVDRDEHMHRLSEIVTALFGLLQRLLYITSTETIHSWWSASSHPSAPSSTPADGGRSHPNLTRVNVDYDKSSVPGTVSDGNNGHFLVSLLLDLIEQEWDFTTESPSWYLEAISLLRYIASIPSNDTVDIGENKNLPLNMLVLRTRLCPAIVDASSYCHYEEKDYDDEGKVIPPPYLGNAIDVAIHSLHKLVLVDPSLADARPSTSQLMYLTSCMEGWIRFLHLIFLFVQRQEEDVQARNEPPLPRTIEVARGEKEDETRSSKMDSIVSKINRKPISFRSLIEDCQDLYTSSYAMILTAPTGSAGKCQLPNSATWGVRDDIKSMMRLQLEELAMDEEEYEELHGASL